jgi:hypothetical protein
MDTLDSFIDALLCGQSDGEQRKADDAASYRKKNGSK